MAFSPPLLEDRGPGRAGQAGPPRGSAPAAMPRTPTTGPVLPGVRVVSLLELMAIVKRSLSLLFLRSVGCARASTSSQTSGARGLPAACGASRFAVNEKSHTSYTSAYQRTGPPALLLLRPLRLRALADVVHARTFGRASGWSDFVRARDSVFALYQPNRNVLPKKTCRQVPGRLAATD